MVKSPLMKYYKVINIFKDFQSFQRMLKILGKHVKKYEMKREYKTVYMYASNAI